MKKFSLKDATTLITGASSGIGRAFAERFAADGSDLILVSRRKEQLESIGAELKKKYSVSINIFQKDLSQYGAARELFQEVQRGSLQVDFLVNNAGFGKMGRFESFDDEQYSQMIHLNIETLVVLSRLFLVGMLSREYGGIINLSSTAAFQPLPYFSVYSATKTFVLLFSEALWGECRKKGIRILALCPGHVKTDFHKKAGVKPHHLYAVWNSKDIVEKAIDALKKNQPTLVPGVLNHFLSHLNRYVSRKCAVRITSQIFRKDFE